MQTTFNLTFIISSISSRVTLPSLSRSYMLNAQFNLSSKDPREVTERATMNSRKSIVPSLFLSNVLNNKHNNHSHSSSLQFWYRKMLYSYYCGFYAWGCHDNISLTSTRVMMWLSIKERRNVGLLHNIVIWISCLT